LPICRLDDFIGETQWEKIKFVSDLQKDFKCPVMLAGDLFHHWKPSPWLLTKAIEYLPNDLWTIFGQHDLQNHSMELIEKSGVYTLHTSGNLTLLPGGHWGTEPEEVSDEMGLATLNRKITVMHRHIYKGKEPWPGCTSPKAISILRKYPEYDLIVTGDNHIPFIQEYQGRLLVNCGSLSRQDADQMDYEPQVWLWYAKNNTVIPVKIPIKKDVITREHIEKDTERDNRIEAFMSVLSSESTTSLDFNRNLQTFLEKNNIRKVVKDIINKAMDYEEA